MLYLNLDVLMLASSLFWLFVFFCIVGPCLRRKYICAEDDSKYRLSSSIYQRDKDTQNTQTLADTFV